MEVDELLDRGGQEQRGAAAIPSDGPRHVGAKEFAGLHPGRDLVDEGRHIGRPSDAAGWRGEEADCHGQGRDEKDDNEEGVTCRGEA